jgi:hypothetical protein
MLMKAIRDTVVNPIRLMAAPQDVISASHLLTDFPPCLFCIGADK